MVESFIKNSILKFLEGSKLLYDGQHGFRPKRSCVTQLLEVMEDLTRLLDEGNSIDIIYLDFKKAFDTVEHNFLYAVLEKFNFGNTFIKWIKTCEPPVGLRSHF